MKNHDKTFAVSSNSLYPPVFEQFLDTCDATGFAKNCASMVQEAAQCEDREIETKEDLRKCLFGSTYVQDLVRRYQRGESRNMLLHETMDFLDFNGEDWLPPPLGFLLC